MSIHLNTVVIAAAWLLGCPAWAQPACPPAPTILDQAKATELAARSTDQGFLWQVTKADRTLGYLFGTMHLGRIEWIFPGPSVIAALARSTSLAVELDIQDPKIRQAFVPDNKPVTSNLDVGDPLVHRLRGLYQRACLDADRYINDPLDQQIRRLTTLSLRDEGIYPEFVVDRLLIDVARGRGMPVVSLETPNVQLEALSGSKVVSSDPRASVSRAIEGLEAGSTRGLLLRMTRAWGSSDSAEFEQFPDWCDCYRDAEEKSAMDQLVKVRNIGLADRMAEFFESTPRGFVAIGTLHMFGEDSVIALLRKKGYDFRAIVPKQAVDRSASRQAALARIRLNHRLRSPVPASISGRRRRYSFSDSLFARASWLSRSGLVPG